MIVRTQGQPAIQGCNAQAAVNENQIIIAAELTVDSPDFGHLEPIVDASVSELQNAGVTESPHPVVADPRYWHKQQIGLKGITSPSPLPLAVGWRFFRRPPPRAGVSRTPAAQPALDDARPGEAGAPERSRLQSGDSESEPGAR